jgi:hypothetical protein
MRPDRACAPARRRRDSLACADRPRRDGASSGIHPLDPPGAGGRNLPIGQRTLGTREWCSFQLELTLNVTVRLIGFGFDLPDDAVVW